MDDAPHPDRTDRQASLALILKAVRRRRGLRPSDVARAMSLPLRTYQRFEAGAVGLDVDRIEQFAEAVDADPWAILLALEMRSPEFALRCLDNKAASVLLTALHRFNAKAGGNIARLDARTLISVFTRTFDELVARAGEDAAYVEQWMFDGPDEDPDEA